MTDKAYLPEGMLLTSEENIYYTSDIKRLEKAMERGIILEGVVTRCDSENMDLSVEVGRYHGIIPREEAVWSRDGEAAKDIAVITRVGKAAAFKITDIVYLPSGEPHLILSRRAAQAECDVNYISSLESGDIIPAVVTHLEPFGAFIDIGCGIISLMTDDSISV